MRSLEFAVKRAFDVLVSILALACLSPVMLIIAILIRATSEGPILFKQDRLGKNGVPFIILKFRTMHMNAPDLRNLDGSAFNSDNDQRVTRVGRFLRKSSLDELPQLINVVKGEMSLVGPRPDEVCALALYSEPELPRLCFRPGITGLAMVNGRNSIPWQKRKEWDVRYVRDFSLVLDFWILLRTVQVIFSGQDVYTCTGNEQPISGQRSS
jgi:lipopolysaccharide/colanic/teichoic acid biosynthesis glycosyltransferase